MPYSIIQEIAATSSRKEKESILEANKDRWDLRTVLYYAYYPLIQYYIKKIPEYTTEDSTAPEKSLSDAFVLLDRLSNRELTGHAAIHQVQLLLSQLSFEDAELLKMMISRDVRAGFSARTINKAFGFKMIPEFAVMLASKQDDKIMSKFKWPGIAQKKADAMRINAFCRDGVVSYVSRNGRHVDANNPTLDGEIRAMASLYDDDILIDGELICYENGECMNRKKSNGYANKAIKGSITDEQKEMFRIEAWDVINLVEFENGASGVDYQTRLQTLDGLLTDAACERVMLIESEMVQDYDEAFKLSQKYIENGYEGIILKDPKAGWEAKRSKSQIKFKAVYDGDFRVVEWEEGKGRNEGLMGAIIVESECGQVRTNVGTGFTDKDRKMKPEDIVGKIVEVEYNEIIASDGRDTYKLYLPVFVEIRNDKNEANTLDELEGLKEKIQ